MAKLKNKICYAPSGLVIFEQSIYDAYNDFPIAIDPMFTDKSVSGNRNRVKVYYCEVCERQFSEAKRSRNSKWSSE